MPHFRGMSYIVLAYGLQLIIRDQDYIKSKKLYIFSVPKMDSFLAGGKFPKLLYFPACHSTAYFIIF